MTDGAGALARLSLNQKTTDRWSLVEAVDACARAGVRSIGVWRDKVDEIGVDRAARVIRDAGLRVSLLCRAGLLTEIDPAEVRRVRDDNRRAVDETAALDAAGLAVVVGGLPSGDPDLPAARQRVAERLAELADYAAERSVRLAVEAIHPMFCADRSVVSSLEQVLELIAPLPAETVGVLVDSFNVWWDPRLADVVPRLAGRIAGYQVSDWLAPTADSDFRDRGMPGDGLIDLAGLTASLDAVGYTGDIEVEIFNAAIQAADPAGVLDTVVRRYVEHVLPR